MAQKQQPPRIDLTDKKSLVGAFNKRLPEMWAAFGTPPAYKDYNPNKVYDFINAVIKKEKAYISDQKKKQIFDVIKSKGTNGKAALQYISNLFLRGAGLGLNDHKENLLRSLIREEIRKVLKEVTLKKIEDEDMKDWLRGIVDMHGDEGVIGKLGNKVKYSANDFEFYFDPKSYGKSTLFFADPQDIKIIRRNM